MMARMNLVVLLLGCLASVASGDEFAFFDACTAGDDAAILASLRTGVDPNYPDENGATPLILAVKAGQIKAAAALLDGGADIELPADYPSQVPTLYSLSRGEF